MNHLRRVPRTIRATSLLALGALGVHELRYLLAYGPDAGGALAHHGHGYLAQVAPPLAALAAAALVAPLVAAGFRARRASRRREQPLLAPSALFAAALLTVFTTQELVEGVLASAHPGGVAGLLAHGGWVAVPLACAFGVGTALVTRVLARAERLLAGVFVRRSGPTGRRRPRVTRPVASFARSPLAALALGFGLARRPPPEPLPSG